MSMIEPGEDRGCSPGHHVEPTGPSAGDVDNTQAVRRHHALFQINVSSRLGPPGTNLASGSLTCYSELIAYQRSLWASYQ